MELILTDKKGGNVLHEDLTEMVIGSYYKVYNKLGYGFLEKVYENALAIECRKAGLTVEKQKNIKVCYDDKVVGDYYADLLIDDLVIVELKASRALEPANEAQLLNYLKATDKEIGILF